MRMVGVDGIQHDVDAEALRRERDQAIAHARALEHELGEVRGKVKRLELMMWRRTARRQRAAAWAKRIRRMIPV
jgi:hypothetical protein